MSKRKIGSFYQSSTKVQRFIKEGRGQGEGQVYIPWTKTHTQEFSSIGRATRVLGVKTRRIHHLQSDNQYRAFLLFEFNKTVVDIRESYPLLDVMEVIDEKEDLRFDKFRDKETQEPYVLTTNFLLTLKDSSGSPQHVARTIKNISELNRKVTWEKLEIERRYWTHQGIDWKVITNKQLSRQVAKNIEWVRETLLEDGFDHDEKKYLSSEMIRYLSQHLDLPLKKVLSSFDQHHDIARGTALYLLRYLIATKSLQLNMEQKIDLATNVEDVLFDGRDTYEID